MTIPPTDFQFTPDDYMDLLEEEERIAEAVLNKIRDLDPVPQPGAVLSSLGLILGVIYIDLKPSCTKQDFLKLMGTNYERACLRTESDSQELGKEPN